MGAAALLLSFGTICGGIAAACVAIAFATDNWLEYSVDRNSIMKIITNVENAKSPEYADVVSDVNRTKIYFDRTVGLWRQCFPTLIPNGLDTYLSPTDTSCVNVDYLKDVDYELDGYLRARVHLTRAVIGLFLAAFVIELVSFVIGLVGCWRRSPGLLVSTGSLMLLAWLLDGGALAIWHGVDYIETRKLNVLPYYLAWPPILQENTNRTYSWSFMLAWIGCGFALIAALFLFAGAGSLRRERRKESERSAQYLMPVYGGTYGEKPPYYAHAYQGPYYYYNTNTYRY